ncbi:glycine betaine ABC transporter substrate-binding protein [Arthrobacter castelli]|uniref:ABC transporter substrate-binding protein n=1 Tax=Arthrobacter castelli TaxID=271431 RepID=UPI0004080350|nr:glycine betaine ABC transporter substrate-binding protein [Arthrobacter castelli]
MNTTYRKTKMMAAFAAILGLTLTACGGGSDDGGNAGGGDGGGKLAGAELAVGSKEFTESKILGQITALALEDAGAEVNERMGISGSATVREALESGEIDMYWDYTGTGWVNILGNTTKNVPDDLYQAVNKADKKKNNVVWLEPAPFENTYRIAVPEEFGQENNLTNMTEAAEFIRNNPDQGAVCAASEFINRSDGLPGLEKFYNFEFSEVVELDLNLIYTQIGESCNFGEVFSTDARIVSNNLTVLEDDKGFFVEYQGALTMRQEVLKQHPAIEKIMAPISAALTDEVITELNGKVDTEGQLERDVAEEWLKSEGFIE